MTLAVDAGGTYFRAEIYSGDTLIDSFSAKSCETGLVKWIEAILESNKKIENVCIAYAGQVKDGVILSAPNIEIDKKEIKRYFENRFDLELFIENDLNCAVLAEAAHYGSRDICSLYVGTGLGLGVLSSSKLFHGFSGMAAELGHIPYRDTPFACGCGKSNCVELFASGSGLNRWKKQHSLPESLTLKELKESSKKEEKELYEEFEKALLYAAGTAITLFNPEILVLGGGVIEKNDYICEILSSKIKDFALPIALQNLKIINSEIKNAPLKGALLLKEKK